VRIDFHPEAYEEMFESARFYEERSEGLGGDFLAAVEETTHRIEQFPDAAPIEKAGVRKRIVFGFPFTILYERQGNAIFIAAVMHQHRKPGYWKERLRS
jgi:toxin ParE1/3/4